MKVAVQKWGNSLALRIPRSLASDSRIRRGSVVEVSVVKGRLVVTSVPERTYRLEDLVAGITRKNRHPEVDRGPAVGREEW